MTCRMFWKSLTTKAAAIAAMAWLAFAPLPALGSQSNLVLPVVGPMSMGTFVGTYLNPALLSVGSCQSGATPPANGPSGAAFSGECWWDTSTTPWVLKFYDGTSWVSSLSLNASTHTTIWTNVVTLTNSQNGSTTILVTNASAAGAALATFGVSNGTGSGAFGIGGTGYSGIALLTNRLFIDAAAASGGIVINNEGGNPTIFGTNSAQVAQFLLGLQVGTTSGDTSGVVNVGVGFRIGNVPLAASNLSNGVSGSGAVALVNSPTFTGTLSFADIIGANVVASGGIQGPNHLGGSVAGSTLTLLSTSGVGTSDKIIFKTGSQVQAGYINTTQQWSIGPSTVALPGGSVLTVSSNTAAIPTQTGLFYLARADGNPTRINIFGAGADAGINYFHSGGTLATPTATLSGSFLGCNFWDGYGTSYQTGGGAGFCAVAEQDFTATHGGIRMEILTTPLNTTSQVLSAVFFASGGLGIGSGPSDPGSGGLFVGGLMFAPNLPTTTGALAAALCWTVSTGQFQRDTNASGCLVSAREYKHDIETLTSSLDVVSKMRAVSFTYNDELQVPGLQEGFIADEMALVDRNLVGFNPDGSPRTVKYLEVSARLVGAIQELKVDRDLARKVYNMLIGIVTDMRADNDNMRDQLGDLRDELATMKRAIAQ